MRAVVCRQLCYRYDNLQRITVSTFVPRTSTDPTMYSYCLLSLSFLSVAFASAWTAKRFSQHSTMEQKGSTSLHKPPISMRIDQGPYKIVWKYFKDVIQTAPTITWCNPTAVDMNSNNRSDMGTISNDQLSAVFNSKNNVQYELMSIPDRGKVPTHAIYGTLLKESCIERYDVYRLKWRLLIPTTTTNIATSDELSMPDIVAVVTIGTDLDGHNHIVHGGILALIIDDVLGFGYYATLLQEHELRLASNSYNNSATNDDFDSDVVAVTANLNINYRVPVPAGSTCIVEATLVSNSDQKGRRIEKDKFHWQVELKSNDRSVTYCQATSLYVIPKRHLLLK
jgi:acyl-coenzyme A thioesterase PaaI-like protein